MNRYLFNVTPDMSIMYHSKFREEIIIIIIIIYKLLFYLLIFFLNDITILAFTGKVVSDGPLSF